MLSFLIVSILIVIFLGYDTQEPKVCKATKEINDMKNVKFLKNNKSFNDEYSLTQTFRV